MVLSVLFEATMPIIVFAIIGSLQVSLTNDDWLQCHRYLSFGHVREFGIRNLLLSSFCFLYERFAEHCEDSSEVFTLATDNADVLDLTEVQAALQLGDLLTQ